MMNDISKALQKELDRSEKRPGIKFSVFTFADIYKIRKLYETYEGSKEFLYIPGTKEIHEQIISDNACYFGAKTDDGQLISVSKIKRLDVPSPFFVPPKYEDGKTGQFFGLSGMLVLKQFRGHRLARITTIAALNALSKMGAAGVYADCDFRNVASFSNLSSTFNFVGYTDGRHGAEGEKTIYTTFYLSFGHQAKKEIPKTILDLSFRQNLDDVPCLLQTQMHKMGPFSSYIVEYGEDKDGKSGHNELHVLDERIQTPNIILILEKEKPITLKKHIIIPNARGYERD